MVHYVGMKIIEQKLSSFPHPVQFLFKKVARSKHIRLHIAGSDQVTVTAPRYCTYKEMKMFTKKNIVWIEQKLLLFQNMPVTTPKLSSEEYLAKKGEAKKLIESKLLYWNQFYNFQWKRLTVRNQKTRWGSYSGNGTLSFHAAIIDLPEELQDYLLVHELCHIQEMNHSQKFWSLMQKTLPDAKLRDQKLKHFSKKTIL